MAETAQSVSITKVVGSGDGTAVFEDAAIGLNSGDPDDPPLSKSQVLEATAIRYCWAAADMALDFCPVSSARVVMPLEGTIEIAVADGQCRRLGLGDMVEYHHATKGDVTTSVIGSQPFRAAVIDLGVDAFAAELSQSDSGAVPDGVTYVRTIDGPDGKSRTLPGQLPYRHHGSWGWSTEPVSISAFQFVLAPSNLDYSWHRAPQRQFVIPMTGGMEVENGLGERHKILPGEIYIGEDISGEGHITRAIDNQERLSIFAHLTEPFAA